MSEFKKGQKVVYNNPIYRNYTKGKIVTLVNRKEVANPFWTIEEGSVGVDEKEIEPLEWRKRYE